MRFPIASRQVKVHLEVGRDRFPAQLLDESMAGFAVSVDVPRRRLGPDGFTSESDCYLFGEIARLRIENSGNYEVQIISIVPAKRKAPRRHEGESPCD